MAFFQLTITKEVVFSPLQVHLLCCCVVSKIMQKLLDGFLQRSGVIGKSGMFRALIFMCAQFGADPNTNQHPANLSVVLIWWRSVLH